MTKEEYDEVKKGLHRMFISDQKALDISFCMSNNTYVVGDMIKDHIGSIKIEKISLASSLGGYPRLEYHGPEYTQAGKPFKNGSFRGVYQSNVKE